MSNYAEQFEEALCELSGTSRFRKAKEMWVYAGGDGGSHKNYWKLVKHDHNLTRPAYTSYCICSHEIARNCFLMNKHTKDVIVVGNCCIKRFMPREASGRTCTICSKPHKNRKNNYCNDCRESCTITFKGKHSGKTFQQVLEDDPNYCEYFLTQVHTDSESVNRFIHYLKNNTTEREKEEVDLGDTKLDFGKHKGKTFKEVLSEDSGYATWFAEREARTSVQKLFQKYISENLVVEEDEVEEAEEVSDEGDLKIEFGTKHRGKRFSEVLRDDTQYCEWFLTIIPKNPNAVLFNNYLKKNM